MKMAKYKGKEINTKPTEGMVSEAQRGLDWREEHGRGGTAVGVARARDIVNGRELSLNTVKRMYSFFARHEVDKQAEGFSQGEKGYPSAGRIAWALWGGDAGQSWAKRIVKSMEAADERQLEGLDMDEEKDINEIVDEIEANGIPEPEEEKVPAERAEPDALSVGDYVEWNASGNKAQGVIKRIERDGKIDVPGSSFVINGTEDNPAALIAIVRDGEETDIMAGHRFSALTKIAKPSGSERFDDSRLAHRAMALDMSPVDEDKRTARIAISSEEPVERSFGKEVLEHTEEAIDLSFLNSGRAPLLLDHDPEKQIGVIESVDLDGSARRLRATVRFGRSGLAKEAFDDVVDGIRANISVGYAIKKMEKDKRGGDTYIAKSWRPVEASLVSIPADVTVGVGRSEEVSPEPVIKTDFKETKMSEVDIAAVEADAKKAAQRNAAQIVELGARHSRSDLAQKAISEGKSIEEFRGELLEVIGSERALESQNVGMTEKEVKRFSLIRAIHALANPTDRNAQEAASFEFECSRAAADQYGRAAQGIMLPAEVLRNWKRDLNSADEAALFTDDFRGGDFIDVLRNASSVMQAGARMLGGLSGDVKIPKKTAAASAAWIATEGGASSESEMTVGSVSLTPKTLGAFTDVTRQLLIQSSLDVEALIRDDLASAIALTIDLGALSGSGSSGQPTGIKNTSGINTVDFGTAPDLVPTFAQVVAMETAVAEDNALMGNLAYIMPAAMVGALKTTEKASNTAQFVVEPGGTVNGYRAIVSNQCAAGDAYFGNFSDLLVGMFGGLDIVVDPYTASTSGTVRVVALQSCDVAVRHAVSFCLGNDGGS
jgi:HK97 family phage major capsid protein